MNIKEYAKSLGIEIPGDKPLDVEAGKAGYNQYLADVEQANATKQAVADKEKNQSWWDKVSGIILAGNQMGTTMSDNPAVSSFNAAVEAYKNMPEDNKPSDDWTDEERWTFGEKYAQNKESAYEYAKQLNIKHAENKKLEQKEKIANATNQNTVTRVLGSAASLALNAVWGYAGYLDALAQKAAGRDTIQQDILMPHEVAETMQGSVAGHLNDKYGTLNENVPILGGKGLGDVYSLGMSIGQSALSGATGGTAGTLVQFFGMSASQGISDALARGANADQALAFGTMSGLAEAIPEMISVKSLLGIASAEGVQNLFKSVLKQAGEEAKEELTTSIITEVADRWIMGGKSQFQIRVNELVASGMDIAQAEKTAWTETIENIAFDVISGAMSGGISGAGAVGVNRVNQQFFQKEANETAKKALSPEASKLIEEAKKYDSTKKRAEALEKKVAEGKELTGYELRMLVSQLTEASRNADVDTVRKAIVEKMKSEGVSDSMAKTLGEIALNKAIGNEVSKVQDLMLKRNENALKVYNQISEEMMESGLGDSEWAQNTPIQRLRAEKRANEQAGTEQRVHSGIERLKADIAAKYGKDTREYKINMASIEGKFGEVDDKIVYKPSENSKIHVDGISSSLTQEDMIELSAIEKIANELGVDIHVYETTVDENGERTYVDKTGMRTSDSGFYDPSDNSIHIDLRAGENGEGTMLYTASHELVHFMKKNAPEHYAALEELVTKELVKGGFSIDQLVEEQRKKDRNGLTDEELREEVVAEACQKFLASKSAVAEIKALKTKNKGLWTTLKKFFTSLFAKINKVYKTVPPDSAEGKYIADMRKAIKPIRDAFMEGAVEAAKKQSKTNNAEIRHKARYTEYNKPITTEDIATLRSIGRKSINEFTSDEIEKAQKWAYKFYSELGEKSPFFRAWFGDWRSEDKKTKQDAITVSSVNIASKDDAIAFIRKGLKGHSLFRGNVKNTDTDFNINIGSHVYNDTLTYANRELSRKNNVIKYRDEISILIKIKEIASQGVLFDSSAINDEDNVHRTFMHYFYTVCAVDDRPYLVKLGVDELNSDDNTTRRAYNVNNIEISPVAVSQLFRAAVTTGDGGEVISTYSIADLFALVKQYDKEFKPKTVNPLLLNKDGTPKVFYHGTRSQFTEFILQDKPKFGRALGDGFYFTPNYSKAHQFANGLFSKGEDRGGIVMPVYLCMSNPFVIEETTDRTKWRNEYHNGDYDGIIDLKNQTWYVEDSTQIKSATDNIGTFDYAEKDIRHKSRSYTAGQAAALKANLSHQKVYTKSTAMKFVKAFAPNIKTKAFDELSNELWIGLNTYTSIDDKRAFAKDMADMLVDRMLVDTVVKHRDWDAANEKLLYLKTGINSIKFRQADIPTLEYQLDKSGLRSLRARWGYKSKEGENKRVYGLDEFITDLSREMPGMAYLADMHPTEAIVEVDKLYEKLKETIKQKYESAYEDATDEQIASWKTTVEAKILDVYEYYGGMSRILQATSSTSEAVDTYLSTVPEGTEKPEKYFVDILKQMDERISYWKAEKSKAERITRWNGIIANKALEIRDFKNGAFLNATQYHPDVFKNSIEELTKVQWRGNISPKGVRKTFVELKQWYTMDNPMLYDKNDKDNNNDLYSDVIAFYIDELAADADVDKPLTADEYPMIYDVMNHLYTIMKNYGKIFRAGRWVDAAEIAKAYIGIIDKNDKKRTAWTRAQSLYNRQFLEPMALAKQADNYNPNGFFTQTMQELRQASVDASVGEMKLRKEYDEFVNANQKYLMNAAKETVKYRGKDIPKLHLIGLYMTMKRKQSREGLALNGFEYTIKTAWWDSETVEKVPGYVSRDDKYNMDLINRATEEQMRIIAENFNDTDRQYMAILERLFNEKLREMKIERDMERQGYTNAFEGYYYPIIRGGIAKNVDTAKFTDVNRSTNSSFNKSTQEHAQQYLKIISADAMINRHIKDMCKYYYMSQAIENYNVLYHIDSDKDNPNRNNPISIAERLKTSKIWEKDFDYFKKLVADIQGIRDNVYDTDGWRFIETIRGNYAKFALGLNAKVLFTQISSVIAAGNVIGFDSIMSVNKNVNFVGTKEDIEKYCPIAAVRSYEQTVLKAMTLSDKMGKISEKMMIGISVMDDLVIRRLFAACEVEANKRGEGEVGSEKNKIAAGKILEQIIIQTQQNSYATEKSSAMRSANPLWRGLTMFTADGMKIISRIHEAAGEFKLAIKNGNAADIKKTGKKLARSIAVAASISVYLAAISTLFNWIYDRDEEGKDDKIVKKLVSFSGDVIGNFIGALPFISDLYDVLVNGFEVEDVALDTINNVYGAINSLYKHATDMWDGTKDRTIEDLNRDLRSLLYAVGQLSGMPVRNLYNLARGIVGNVSPKAGYYIDSKFNETSLVNDLKKTIKQGNENKTSYIMSLIYDERLDKRVSAEQSKEILRLYEKIYKKEIEEYSVLPKDIPDTIKRNGKEYELSDTQKQSIMKEYSKVISALNKLISSSFYSGKTDKDKAYLIDYYHDKYYEVAVNKALKISDVKVYLYNAIGFSTYAKFAFVTRGIESDKDKNGNTVSGSKKTKLIEAISKVSKDENKNLLYIASLGYSLTELQTKKLCKYLNSLSVSASQKRYLAESCNLTYKNGKIYP